LVYGLEPVARFANNGLRATLLVEDDFHLRGRVGGANELPVISTDLDVREPIDDVVDAVVEKVLQCGGKVVFAPEGTLSEWNRIVLLVHGAEEA
jgi:hypothetical protein